MALTNAERQAAFKARRAETMDALAQQNAALLAEVAELRAELDALKEKAHRLEVAALKAQLKAAQPEKAEDGASFLDNINPDSLQVLTGCRAEPSLAEAQAEERFQFEREGYFCVDLKDSAPGKPVFNRTVTLRDSWGQ